MNVINNTPLTYAFGLGMGEKRKLLYTVITKGTFSIPVEVGEKSRFAEKQVAVREADEFPDGDITLPILFEAENVPVKKRGDIILIGSAYAGKGDPKRVIDTMVRVGKYGKILRVFGNRQWVFPTKIALVPIMSEPELFETMPLTYDRAFGGMDKKAAKICRENLSGKGFIGKKDPETVHELALPNIEDPRDLISSWDDHPKPVGYAYFNSGWLPRIALVGQYSGNEDPDEPIQLPEKFDPLFYNAAHPDLQVNGYFEGNERVDLRNVSPQRKHEFDLPGVRPRIEIDRYVSEPDFESDPFEMPETERIQLQPVLDTIIFRPDDLEYELIWRTSIEIQNLESVPIDSVTISIA